MPSGGQAGSISTLTGRPSAHCGKMWTRPRSAQPLARTATMRRYVEAMIRWFTRCKARRWERADPPVRLQFVDGSTLQADVICYQSETQAIIAQHLQGKGGCYVQTLADQQRPYTCEIGETIDRLERHRVTPRQAG
jgi:hypothetical protein